MVWQIFTMNANSSENNKQPPASPAQPFWIAGFSLLLVLAIIYWPSFQGGWFLDDFPNIVENPNIQIKSLAWPEMAKSLYGRNLNQQGINRPLAYFSFAVNHYFHGNRVFGYHLINFIIHYLGAIFLFLFIHRTLHLSTLKKRYGEKAFFVALLATFFWATHPIQVTAVTYIVQRMASMASMFYIMACYFYLRARTASDSPRAILNFCCCGLAGLLSLASKENGAMLPLTLLIYDILLLQADSGRKHIANLKTTAVSLLVLLAIGLYFTDFASIVAAYDTFRPYTIMERLLTEPRVLIFYFSLLLYPASDRFTLLYDMGLSRSLWEPWSTTPALLFLLSAVGLLFFLARRRPLWAFCIIFFYLNHLIESSFIGLEPIFEHRNHLPTMLFFVPFALITAMVLDCFSYHKTIHHLAVAVVLLTITAQAHTTYLRNRAMQDPISFWQDNVVKSPDLSRPHAILGRLYLEQGFDPEAITEIKTALRKNNYVNNSEPVKYLTYLGNYYLEHEDRPGLAMDHYLEALEKHGSLASTYDGMAMAMLRLDNIKLAETFSRQAVAKRPFHAQFQSNLALIMLKAGNPAIAYDTATQALILDNGLLFPIIVQAEALRMQGKYQQAIERWRILVESDPTNLAGFLALAELYSLNSQPEALNRTFALLETKIDKNQWLSILDQNLGIPAMQAYNPDQEMLRPLMREYITLRE